MKDRPPAIPAPMSATSTGPSSFDSGLRPSDSDARFPVSFMLSAYTSIALRIPSASGRGAWGFTERVKASPWKTAPR